MTMRPPPDPRFGPMPPYAAGGARPPIRGYSFSDRVMADVAREPRPTPVRVFMRSLARLSIADAAASLAAAWRLALKSPGSVPAVQRLTSLALVLVVVTTIGVGGPLAFSTGMGAWRSLQAPAGPALGGPTLPSTAPATAPAILLPDASPTPRAKPTPKPKATPRKKASTEASKATPRPQAKKSSSGSTPRAGAARKAKNDDRREREKPEDTHKPEDTPEPREHDDD